MNGLGAKRALFAVIEREGLKKGIWARIGSAFQNKDGCWNLTFDLLPMRPDTTTQMREELEEKSSGESV